MRDVVQNILPNVRPGRVSGVDGGLGEGGGRTTGSGNRITLQTDGNLVVYSSGGTSLWSSGTAGSGTSNRLIMQSDRNLVRYGPSSSVWSSGTAGTSGPVTGAGTALAFNNANQITPPAAPGCR